MIVVVAKALGKEIAEMIFRLIQCAATAKGEPAGDDHERILHIVLYGEWG